MDGVHRSHAQRSPADSAMAVSVGDFMGFDEPDNSDARCDIMKYHTYNIILYIHIMDEKEYLSIYLCIHVMSTLD